MDRLNEKGMDVSGKNLPDEIYASIVKSIYADAKSLFVGILCLALAPLAIFWKTGENIQLIFSASFLIFGLIRLILNREFHFWVREETTRSEFVAWENRYILLSSLYVGLLGIWTVQCLWYSADDFAKTVALSLSLCYASAIFGRNFGSDRIVVIQTLLISILLLVGLAGSGEIYDLLLAAFLVPYFVAIRMMSKRLGEMLYSAEIAAQENKTTATRLDTALESIIHGIAMISRDGRIAIANERFLTLTNMVKMDIIGARLEILKRSRIITANGETLIRRLEKHLSAGTSTKFTFRLPDDRVIEADFNSISEGGVLVLTDITERVQSEKAIRDLANYDALTKLPNRRFFVSEIERRLMRRGELRPCSMYFIDLDKFKEVNDTLGHEIGDKLLQSIAGRFSKVLKNTDLMCRFGGDEFVVVVPGIIDEHSCGEIAGKLISELSQPFEIRHHSIIIGASAGIAIAPRDGKTAEELLQFTDAALYESKSRGRGQYTFYSEELGGEIRQKRELELDLRTAIREGTLELHFQPLVNISKAKISTCEALARWNHPVYGAISPERFIRIAEESGFIDELGTYVFRQAMTECRKWGNDVRVAVNVSGIQFHRSDVYGTVSRLLRETGLAPERLEVEITESVMLANFDETIAVLNRLAKLGVKISLDDFGTGFSSLSYLHQLPLDKVKIDRSFIKNWGEQSKTVTLLKGVVVLTKALGLTVVLEGIETDQQLQQITAQMNIDEVQGFLFSRPLPAKDVLQLLGSDTVRNTAAGQLPAVIKSA